MNVSNPTGGKLPPNHMQYPLSAFPIISRNAIEEVVQNIQGPVSMSALSAITAMSAVCQPLIKVKLPTGQEVPASMNTATVAESGERKTATDKLMMGPLYAADAARMKNFEEGITDYEAAMRLWKIKLQAIERKISAAVKNAVSKRREATVVVGADGATEWLEEDQSANNEIDWLSARLAEHMRTKPERERLRRTIRQEITPRAMMEALQGDGESIVLNSEEGGMLLSSQVMWALGQLNKCWDSPEILGIDRAQLENIVVRNPRVSVSFMVQSAVLEAFLERRGKVMRGSGNWARYLVAWPESTQGSRFMPYMEPVWHYLPVFHARMIELVAERERQLASGHIEVDVIEFDDDARVAYVNLQNHLEPMLRPMQFLNDIKDFASKAAEMTGRLAGLFHKFSAQQGKITGDMFHRAWAIVEWHMLEFKRIFSPPAIPLQAEQDADVLLPNLHTELNRRGVNEIAESDIVTLAKNLAWGAARTKAALQALYAAGHFRIEPMTIRGRRTAMIERPKYPRTPQLR
ncbi:Uncharacterised protein [Burkholderia pseudomallei]|nr:Uncharacterised protein [Burkholderia pseudomallei]